MLVMAVVMLGYSVNCGTGATGCNHYSLGKHTKCVPISAKLYIIIKRSLARGHAARKLHNVNVGRFFLEGGLECVVNGVVDVCIWYIHCLIGTSCSHRWLLSSSSSLSLASSSSTSCRCLRRVADVELATFLANIRAKANSFYFRSRSHTFLLSAQHSGVCVCRFGVSK